MPLLRRGKISGSKAAPTTNGHAEVSSLSSIATLTAYVKIPVLPEKDTIREQVARMMRK